MNGKNVSTKSLVTQILQISSHTKYQPMAMNSLMCYEITLIQGQKNQEDLPKMTTTELE